LAAPAEFANHAVPTFIAAWHMSVIKYIKQRISQVAEYFFSIWICRCNKKFIIRYLQDVVVLHLPIVSKRFCLLTF
jgi:hypothetical protein